MTKLAYTRLYAETSFEPYQTRPIAFAASDPLSRPKAEAPTPHIDKVRNIGCSSAPWPSVLYQPVSSSTNLEQPGFVVHAQTCRSASCSIAGS